MRLFYRGESYDYNPERSMPGETGRSRYPSHRRQTPYTLIYRGVTLQVDPTVPRIAAPTVPKSYRLIYRGITHEVVRQVPDRSTTASSAATTSPAANSLPEKPVVIPSTLPRKYIHQHTQSVHRANLLKNLQRRMRVAREGGDQKLLELLKAEQRHLQG